MARVSRWAFRLIVITVAIIAADRGVETQGTLNGRTVRFDSGGKLLSWVADQSTAYHQVLALNTNFLLNGIPNGSNGLKLYYSYSYASPSTLQPANWPHNPAGLYAMLTDSGLAYSAYTGNPVIMNLVRDVLTYHLDHGMTPATWHWPSVPYASGDAGATTYQGAAVGNSSGSGDGVGVIQPDKIGELAVAFLKYYRYSGVDRFRDAAIQSANVLASHVRTGNASSSPWPFRVYAQTNAVRENYTAHVIPVIRLFDELIRLNFGNVAAYRTARQAAWTWLMTYPMQNNVWSNYFEDVEIQSDLTNYNQLVAGETARYLMQRRDLDPDWQTHVRGIISWIESRFAEVSFGANSISEQMVFHHPMGSHTSRYASLNAMLYELTGDLVAKDKAFRSFNWATYMCNNNGRTIDGPEVNNMWWTDGFGDYIKHFMSGIGAVPEWAPPGQNHLLRSSSIVRSVTYAAQQISYETADPSAEEVLRLGFTPQSVTADGVALPLRSDLAAQGWTFDAAGGVLRVRHDNGTRISISSSTQEDNAPPTATLTVPDGTSYTAPAFIPLDVVAADSDGSIFSVDFRANGVSLGLVYSPSPDGSYDFTWGGAPPGEYDVTALASDDRGAATMTNVLHVRIAAPPNISPSASITSPANDAGFTAPASIAFTVAASDPDGVLTKVELLRNGTVLQTLTPPLPPSPMTITWSNVAAGDYSMTVRVTDDDSAATVSNPVLVHVTNPSNGLPSPWLTADVGAVGLAGSATYSNGVFTARGSGVDIWDRTDSFRYVYQPIRGDADIRARVTSLQNTDPWAKAGVMIRETLATGSRHMVMAVTRSNGLWAGVRTTTGGTTTSGPSSSGSAPYWVRVVRQGNTFRWYRSTDGVAWTQVGSSTTISMPADAFAGLVITSHNNTVLNTATFEQVSLIASTSDTTPPTVPTNVVTTFVSATRVDIGWTAATDNDAVASYTILRNGSTLGTSMTTSYSDTTVANGVHYDYAVRAVDRSGNVGPVSAVLGVTTPDTQAPQVAITTPADGASVQGTNVSISANASDNVGVASVQFLLDGVNLGAEDTTAPYSTTWDSRTAANGSQHVFSARARDVRGNSAVAPNVTVTVSNVSSLVAALSFDENTGSSAADSSGSGNNATLSSTTWTTGRFGSGLAFNGSSSRVTIADASSLDLTNQMTLEAWVRPTTLSGWTTVILKERSGGLSYALYGSDNTNRPPAGYANISSGDRAVLGTTNLPLNSWTYLAMTYDGANMRLYVNGALVATRAQTGSAAVSTSPLRIGSNAIWGEYFNGAIDEVRIYNRMLSQTEIQTDMNTRIRP